jgi:hypothetical protein
MWLKRKKKKKLRIVKEQTWNRNEQKRILMTGPGRQKRRTKRKKSRKIRQRRFCSLRSRICEIKTGKRKKSRERRRKRRRRS